MKSNVSNGNYPTHTSSLRAHMTCSAVCHPIDLCVLEVYQIGLWYMRPSYMLSHPFVCVVVVF